MTKALQQLLPDWSSYLDPEVEQLLPHYHGTLEERQAQALRDMAQNSVEKHDLYGLRTGGILNEIKKKGLYKYLGYASMDEYLSSERVGNLGKNQNKKWMDVAQACAPPTQLQAPTLQAQVLNPNTQRPLLTPDFVMKVGIERSSAVVKKWDKSTPEKRQELLEAAQHASSKDFYDTAYGSDQERVSFSVNGDDILLWRDDIGTKVAKIVSLDPQDRSDLLDRLGITPQLHLL